MKTRILDEIWTIFHDDLPSYSSLALLSTSFVLLAGRENQVASFEFQWDELWSMAE